MSKQLILFLWVLAGTLCPYSVFSQEEKLVTMQPPKDILWGGITGMSQDPQGFLWFATQSGLYKFDGHHYTGYKHEVSNPASLATVALEDVFAARDGSIWIATYGAGLDRLNPTTNTFTHYRHHAGVTGSLSDDKVSCILSGRDGKLWIGTNSGLEQFEPKTGTFKHFIHRSNDPGSLSNNQVRIIYEDRQGTLWVGTGSVFPGESPNGEGGLNRLDKNTGKFTRYLHDPANPGSLADNRIQAIFEDSKGVFWVGSAGDGLHIMDRAKGTFTHFYHDPQHPEKLSRPSLKSSFNWAEDHITFINEDHSGKIWIGTFENGISAYDPATKKMTWYGTDPNCDTRIGKNEFWRAFKTRDGSLWLAPWQSNEFYKVTSYQSKVPFVPVGKTVMGFGEGRGNHLWIATTTGLIDQNLNDQSMKVIPTDKNIPAGKDFINAIEKDGDDRLWLSTMHGLYQYDINKNSFKAYHTRKGDLQSLPSDSVYGAKVMPGNKLWFAGQNGAGVLDTRTGLVKRFLNDPKDSTSISNNLNYAVETDKQNRVWVATSFGFDRFDENTGHFKRYLKGLATNCVYKNQTGELWAGTDLGVFKYNPAKDIFSRVGASEIQVYGLTQDHEGSLWSSMTQGIQKITPATHEELLYSTDQDVDPQVLSGMAYTRPDGEVLIGNNHGYYRIDPVKLRHSIPPPSAIINQFFLADAPVFPAGNGILTRPVFDTKEIRLNHDQSAFSFGLADIDFSDPTNNDQLSYLLQNYDTKWRQPGPDESVVYFAVPPGKYVFKVKSINVNGLTSEKQISLVISPPWWQTWWALILFSLLLAGGAWSFAYYRSRSLVREKRVLEQKVQLRTEEVLQQKVEIEGQRDDLSHALEELKNTQTQLVQREKMASLGELTAGIAHEIQNPLNFVNNFSEVSVELLAELKEEGQAGRMDDVMAIADDLTLNLQKINHHGKRADSIVKGMLEHSRVGTGKKQLTDVNALADEFLKLAYQGMRSKDKSFHAEIAINLDPELPKAGVVQQDLGTVLINLFNNAFYAVHQQAKIAGETYRPKVELATTFANGQIVISVKDNGNGIPEVIRGKIMQPFFTTKPTGEGTGLGLSLSYDIVVKGHGGTIQVNSAEGLGSEFIISVPVN